MIVDLHTTNGSYHGYHLTYAPPLNPNTDAAIMAFTRERLLPSVRSAMVTRHRFRTYDYGNFATLESLDEELEGFATGDTRQKVWRTYDARPRFGGSYLGLRNRISILSEAYSYLDFESRVRATEAFVEEIMRFVAENATDIRALITRADAEWSRGEASVEGGVAFALRRVPQPVDVLVGAIETRVNPRSGKPMSAMVESAITPASMVVFDGFVSTATRPVPRDTSCAPPRMECTRWLRANCRSTASSWREPSRLRVSPSISSSSPRSGARIAPFRDITRQL